MLCPGCCSCCTDLRKHPGVKEAAFNVSNNLSIEVSVNDACISALTPFPCTDPLVQHYKTTHSVPPPQAIHQATGINLDTDLLYSSQEVELEGLLPFYVALDRERKEVRGSCGPMWWEGA